MTGLASPYPSQIRDEGGLPATDRDRDFHPRVVELFTDNARLTWGRYIGLQQPEKVAYPTILTSLFALIWSGRRLLAGGPRVLWALLSASLAALVGAAWRWRDLLLGLKPPPPDNATSLPEIKQKVARNWQPRGNWTRKLHVFERGLPLRLVTVWDDLRGRPAQETARRRTWDTYRQLRHNPDYPRAVYVRGIPWESTGGLVLEYWQFYFYDDQPPPANHQADWEVAMVFLLKNQSGGLEPASVACSAHTGGFWRDAPRITTTRIYDGDDGWHPLLWVSGGSHAAYFQDRKPPPALKEELSLSSQRFQFVAQLRRGWLDHLPKSVVEDVRQGRLANQRYELRLFPDVKAGAVPDELGDLWDNWWWLTYSGEWGNSGLYPWEVATRGPAQHPKKWQRPWEWVAEDCQYDATSFWQEISRESSALRAL